MIEKTKQLVESNYNIANGYSYDAQVIYGDTDSVMIKFGTNDIREAMELGEKAAVFVTQAFIKPIKLEFEKVYLPYLLMNKKRYAGMLYTQPNKYDYMDAKGIETVRRDNCLMVKNVIQTVLNHVLIERNVSHATEYTKNIISKLLQNKMDMSLLVISKALGKLEEYKSKMAHVELAKKMMKRDPGSAPKIGDRVAYVIVKGAKNSRAFEKAEDPLFALENGMALDTDYYLEHQLKQPLLRIFEPILGDKVNTLFNGKHTRVIKKTTNVIGAMMKFTVVKKTCIGCKCALKKNELNQAVCNRCKQNESKLYLEKISILRQKETKFHELWSQCQRCQGSFMQEVLCSNRDCPIFYRRTKARKDLQTAQKVLKQFSF